MVWCNPCDSCPLYSEAGSATRPPTSMIQNDSDFLQGQMAEFYGIIAPELSRGRLNMSHISEDCHDPQSSVVVACRMPHDPNHHRVGECGDRMGRESRRLHSAADGAAGGLPGNGDPAYRDVRCAEFDRAALSALLR